MAGKKGYDATPNMRGRDGDKRGGNDAEDLPAGTAGTAAIYTKSAGMTHIIRKVMIRMESYMNFIIPWL